MNPTDIANLISVLKEQGITHFKNGDFELTFGQTPRAAPLKLVPTTLEKPPVEPEKEIPSVIHEMKTVFSMKDEDLVEKLFPIPKEDEA